ncbi:hypothetical protein [Sphingomonas sp. S2-65]|uniref:hypothetical protein n=1 Tax=Sphingomonas sp. S2-65 TaxID=2903960 RepID=UPI001F39C75A|nr:hypothetical protein [Sphingomonas sp. S2-65]UYY59046.1 hypothetical protein LZ586_02795 [Sphingomonas sp. S2-65]
MSRRILGAASCHHVYSNQAFTHQLYEYGVPCEAEEYRGGWRGRHWTPDGRVRSELLPFFDQTLLSAG